MQENIEIEYKHLLNEDDYEKLLTYFQENNALLIAQENYYFETINHTLKTQNKALRIRIINNQEYEICLKTKRENDLLENNYLISKDQFNKIISNPNLLNDILNTDEEYIILGSLKNLRYELKTKQGLYALDQSSYFDVIDYEIEFEANNYESEIIFNNFLADFSIKYKSNHNSKIARFIKQYNLYN